jgi:hypothetical protein
LSSADAKSLPTLWGTPACFANSGECATASINRCCFWLVLGILIDCIGSRVYAAYMVQIITDTEKAAYLAAFIDGEGHIGLHLQKTTGHYTREIEFNNTDKLLFDAVCQICRDLGFPVATYFIARSLPDHDVWKARVSGRKAVYERFLDMIPLQSPRKVQKLKEVISSYQDRAALDEALRSGNRITCANCKTTFYVPPSSHAVFCSSECHNIHRQRRVTKICEICSVPFEVMKSRSRRRFCSLECAGKAQSDRLAELGKRTIAKARAARMKRFIQSEIPIPRGC